MSSVRIKSLGTEVLVDEEGYTQCFSLDEDPLDAQRFFEKYGFCVFRDVLTVDDCNHTLDDIYGFLEYGTGFKRNDKSTWSNWPENSIERYGSVHKPPIFTPQFLRNRQNPLVHKAFSLILGEEDLLVNHDRCCFFRPTRGVLINGFPSNMPQWGTAANLHIDMNPWEWMGDGASNRRTLEALDYSRVNHFINENNQPSHQDGRQLQGVLNLADNHIEDGGFQCIPGFHKQFDAYFNSFPKPQLGQPSYNFKPKEGATLGTRVSMRKGSMVLWDQKMAHGSLPNASAQFRSAQFIKMFPRRTVSDARLRNRAAAVSGQIQMARFESEVTDLGRKVFGLTK